MAGGECHMMIGLCEVNWGGCHEGESSDGPGAPPRPVDSHGETPYREFASSLTNRFEPTSAKHRTRSIQTVWELELASPGCLSVKGTPQDRAGV